VLINSSEKVAIRGYSQQIFLKNAFSDYARVVLSEFHFL
jgi:hypothetical protein